MSVTSDCLFCKIIDKKISSTIVYENEGVLGFKDINPQAPIHILFIPKQHVDGVHAVNSKKMGLIEPLVFAANEMAQKLKVDQSGYRLVFNSGKDGGQMVNHLHLHLLGGRSMHWPPG